MAAQMARLPGSVSLCFDQQLREGQFKLLEVSEAMLAEIAASEFDAETGEAKGIVELRGSLTDEAALCTSSKTFSVRLVESSNTQLLVCANPKNIFLPVDADELYAPASDVGASPAKRQKRAAAPAASGAAAAAASASTAAAEDVFVPQRIIRGLVQHHYEVTEILPRLHVLRELLSRALYLGDDEEQEALEAERAAEAEEAAAAASAGDSEEKSATPAKRKRVSPPRYTTAALRQLVQASDAQLREGLQALEAFEDAQGHWRLLHPDLAGRVLDSILTYTEERQWNRTVDLPADECAQGLKELYDPRITRHVLKIFSRTHTEEGTDGSDPNMCSLDPAKVCLLRAMQLFAKKEPYPHIAFMADWQASVPAGMSVSPAMLRGHALCETSTALEALSRTASGAVHRHNDDATRVWRYFPVSSLSPLVKTRFQQLFDVRARWTLDDITPYTQDMCAPGQTLEQLLLKHARPVSAEINGQKQIVYTKK